MSEPFVFDRQAVAEVCRRFQVKRLAMFGSSLTAAFDATRSDVDLLVEFGNGAEGLFDAYFGLKEALEQLFGRPVDLVMPKALENPYFAATVDRSREEIYAA